MLAVVASLLIVALLESEEPTDTRIPAQEDAGLRQAIASTPEPKTINLDDSASHANSQTPQPEPPLKKPVLPPDPEKLVLEYYGSFEILEVEINSENFPTLSKTDLLLEIPGRSGNFLISNFGELPEERQDFAWQAAYEMINLLVLQLRYYELSVHTGAAELFESVAEAEQELQKRGSPAGVHVQPIPGTESCYIVNFKPLFDDDSYKQLAEDARALLKEAKVSIVGNLDPNL